MKKLLALLLTAALFCTSLTLPAAAAGDGLTYRLSSNGETQVEAKTGDTITVVYTVLNSGGTNYELNTLQNEIRYDEAFFELVEGSISIQKGDGGLKHKLAGDRIYMNDVLAAYAPEQIVGSFQLKVIAKQGSGKVESTEAKAYAKGGSAFSITLQDLTVTVEGSGTPVTPGTPARPDQPGTGCTGGPECPSRRYEDVVQSKWYHEAVDYVVSGGLMNGVSDVRFAPDANMSRAMLVTVLYRMEGSPACGEDTAFTDVVAGSWYAKAVAWAGERGIVKGTSAVTFAPDDYVTREQIAAILYRYSAYKGYPIAAGQSLDSFVDGDSVSAFAVEAMRWAVAAELIRGRDGGRLEPGATAARAEVATMLMRYSRSIVK